MKLCQVGGHLGVTNILITSIIIAMTFTIIVILLHVLVVMDNFLWIAKVYFFFLVPELLNICIIIFFT